MLIGKHTCDRDHCRSHVIYSVNPAIATGYSRAGVVVNFVTATGGDVEMLRSIECFYKYVPFHYHLRFVLTHCLPGSNA